MYNSNNIFGIQKTEEISPRSNLDVVLGASNTAAMGARLGSNFGPIGTGVGAGVGFVAGLGGQIASRNVERQQLDAAQSYNKYVSNLSGRMVQNENMVPIQARNGVVSSESELAEIEGNEKTGFGEIHVDKNYNIKNIANGQPSHENGGMKVMMNKSDIVFDTQKSPDKYKKVMENIRKYKLSGDKRAKDWLDKEAASKPTDSDYGYRKYPEGKKNEINLTNKGFFDENGKWITGSKYYAPTTDKILTVDYPKYDKFEIKTGVEEFIPEKGIEGPLGTGTVLKREPTEDTETIIKPTESEIKPTESELEVPIIEENENPLKYTNVLNNIIQGTKTPEKSTRRYYTPETLQSIDRSYAIRNAIIEEREAEKESLRGKGLSVGQQQSYMGQIGGRYLGKMEEVNEREAQRSDEMQKYNAANRMQAAQSNLGLALQYDTQDAQNRAMRQNYINAAAQETAQIGDISEQRNYMIQRDNKDYQMEKTRFKYLGTENMKPELGADGKPTGRFVFRKSTGNTVIIDKDGKIVE